MADTLDTLLDQAERNLAQAERLHARKTRAAEHSPVMPAMTDGPQVTVSIAWINWMIEFFEGGPYDPPTPERDPTVTEGAEAPLSAQELARVAALGHDPRAFRGPDGKFDAASTARVRDILAGGLRTDRPVMTSPHPGLPPVTQEGAALLRAIVADVEQRYPAVHTCDSLSDWTTGVAWMLQRLRTIAQDAAP